MFFLEKEFIYSCGNIKFSINIAYSDKSAKFYLLLSFLYGSTWELEKNVARKGIMFNSKIITQHILSEERYSGKYNLNPRI